jgi:hypothetical protein
MYWYKDVIKNLSTHEVGKIDYAKYSKEAKLSLGSRKDLWNK